MKYKIIYKGDDPIARWYLHRLVVTPFGKVASWNEVIEDWDVASNQELYDVVILESE